MDYEIDSLFFDSVLAIKLLALPLPRYLTTLALAGVAFATATNIESVLGRTISLVGLGLYGVTFLFIGIGSFAVVDILLGLLGIGAALYAWNFTRI